MIHTLPNQDLHVDSRSLTETTESAISVIQSLSVERGLRLTAARLKVLRVLAASSAPMKAYAILETLRESNPKAGPALVYRALDFLQVQGWAIKLNSINAFMLKKPGAPWSQTYLVCEQCFRVTTVDGPSLRTELVANTRISGFIPAASSLEIVGTCSGCVDRRRTPYGSSPGC